MVSIQPQFKIHKYSREEKLLLREKGAAFTKFKLSHKRKPIKKHYLIFLSENNFSLALNIYINFLIFVSIIKLINSLNDISLKFNRTGEVTIINPSFSQKPNRIFHNGVSMTYTNIININDMNDIVILQWDSNINTCSKMFQNLADIAEIDLSNFDSSFVTDTSYMFHNCISLTSINLNGFITSSVVNMEGMFYEDSSLRNIDLSQFDTAKVKNMNHFLMSCYKIHSVNVSSFDTSQVTTMQNTFRAMHSLEFLNLSNFDTSKVKDMYGIFSFCYELSSLVIKILILLLLLI